MPEIVLRSAASAGDRQAEMFFLLEFQGKFETCEGEGLAGRQVGQLCWEGVRRSGEETVLSSVKGRLVQVF